MFLCVSNHEVHQANAALTLGHPLRCWGSINPTMAERIVFAKMTMMDIIRQICSAESKCRVCSLEK